MDHKEETAIVQSFIVKEKRERFRAFLSDPKRRREITRRLAHSSDVDGRQFVPIPPTQQTPDGIARLLRLNGAGGDCYVISENAEIDGRRMPLSEALAETVGYGMGTIISCIPGALAFYEGEALSNRVLLLRKA
jgi:hypothetical protein